MKQALPSTLGTLCTTLDTNTTHRMCVSGARNLPRLATLCLCSCCCSCCGLRVPTVLATAI